MKLPHSRFVLATGLPARAAPCARAAAGAADPARTVAHCGVGRSQGRRVGVTTEPGQAPPCGARAAHGSRRR
jgi:hypothetical protein